MLFIINRLYQKVFQLAIYPNKTTINQHFLINILMYLFLDLNQHNHVLMMPKSILESYLNRRLYFNKYKPTIESNVDPSFAAFNAYCLFDN